VDSLLCRKLQYCSGTCFIAVDGEFFLLPSSLLVILLTEILQVDYNLEMAGKNYRVTVERVHTRSIAADGKFFLLPGFLLIILLTGILQLRKP
jgi:hypothetical protein